MAADINWVRVIFGKRTSIKKLVIACILLLLCVAELEISSYNFSHPDITCKNQSSGCASGTLEVPGSMPDIPPVYQLTGIGTFPDMGAVNVTGELRSPGFIASGHAGGTVTISNALGSLKFQMSGPEQPGFSPLPETMTYKIESGTQKYASMQGEGTIDIQLSYDQQHKEPGTFELTFHPDKK